MRARGAGHTRTPARLIVGAYIDAGGNGVVPADLEAQSDTRALTAAVTTDGASAAVRGCFVHPPVTVVVHSVAQLGCSRRDTRVHVVAVRSTAGTRRLPILIAIEEVVDADSTADIAPFPHRAGL